MRIFEYEPEDKPITESALAKFQEILSLVPPEYKDRFDENSYPDYEGGIRSEIRDGESYAVIQVSDSIAYIYVQHGDRRGKIHTNMEEVADVLSRLPLHKTTVDRDAPEDPEALP